MQIAGLVQIASRFSVDETVDRLTAAFRAKELQLFALVMRPTKLLIFGSPKGGTPMMVAAPTMAIDLPLKALVWEDQEGKVWLACNSPEYLQQRHGVPADLIKNIAGVEAMLRKAVE